MADHVLDVIACPTRAAGRVAAIAEGMDADRQPRSRSRFIDRPIAAIAERLKAKGIDKVVFDRNGYIYYGRILALADAAREAGLKF